MPKKRNKMDLKYVPQKLISLRVLRSFLLGLDDIRNLFKQTFQQEGSWWTDDLPLENQLEAVFMASRQQRNSLLAVRAQHWIHEFRKWYMFVVENPERVLTPGSTSYL